MPAQLLLIDDDRDLCAMLEELLAGEGFGVASVHSGPAALTHLGEHRVDLAVLDVMLPGMSGFDVLRTVRRRSAVPVLMLTARGDAVDRIVGLEVGADDYIAKPFDPRELVARVRSVVRRVQAAATPAEPAAAARLAFGNCTLDLAGHRLFDADGAEVPLTSMEFDLLRAFAESPNRVLSRDQLLTLTRHREWEPFDRSIDIRIAKLRRKVEPDPAHPRLIKTVRNAGYMYIPGAK